MKRIFTFLLLMLATTGLFAADNKPNIIIFFADDMGYGDLGCFGNPNIHTPNIDKLATEGMKCTSFYVAGPVCTPSRAGLVSGRYPIHTLPGNLGPSSKGGYPAEEPMISEMLKKAGYRTMAIGKWHLGHSTNKLLPTGRGFDHYYGLPYSNDMIRPWVNTDIPLKLYIDDQPVKTVNYDQESLTIDYTIEAQKFIKEKRGKPFFLYLPYSMPHLPISTTDKFRDKSEGGLYGDVIETIDWSVGEIIKTLNELNMDNNTLMIFTSDNGPWHNLPDRMLQRGVKPWHQGTAGLLHGAKATTYDGGMRVPGIFYWKGIIPGGQVSSDIVSTLDIFPTLIEIAGVEIPENKKLDGYSLVPFLKGLSPSPRKEFYYFRGRTLEAIRSGKWKLRYSNAARPEVESSDPVTPELYDLKNDPGENYNMADIHPDIVEQLMNKMKEKADEVGGNMN